MDKLDKELEYRGLRFSRYADDITVFLKTEIAAQRVMESITSWIERKLFLKVNTTKTKVVKPSNGKFLGFTYCKTSPKWEVKPTNEKKTKFYQNIKRYLIRKEAVARTLAETFTRLNQMIRRWINYFRIEQMKNFIDK